MPNSKVTMPPLNLRQPSRQHRQLPLGSPDALNSEIASMRVNDVEWRKIAWKTCLLDGLKASREQNKPIILWVFIDQPVDDKRC